MASIEMVASVSEKQADEMGPKTSSSVPSPRASHAALLTAAQLCRGVVRMLFVVVVARSLGPRAFGVYALLLATIEMVAVASGSSYTDYLTREAAIDKHLGWGLTSQLIALRSIVTLPLIVLGVGILWLLHYPSDIIVAAVWFSTSLLFRNVNEAVQGVLRGTGHYCAFLLIELAIASGLATGVGLLLVRGGGLRVVVTTEVAAAAMGAVLAASLAIKLRPACRSHVGLQELLKSSAIFNIYGFVGNLYDRVDVLILSKLAGNYATGIYSAAYRPLGTAQLLPYGILFSLLPVLSQRDPRAADRERLQKAMGFLLCFSFLIILVTVAFADSIVPLVYGPGFSESATALKFLVWAIVLRYVNYALNIKLLALRQERVFVTTCLICLAVNVFGNLALIPKFSWRAAAVMTLATEFVLFAQNVYWLRRTIGTVPKPTGWLRTSVVFVCLLALSVAGAKLVSPAIIGSACVLLFLGYLYRAGMVAQFAAAWGSMPTTGFEGSNS